VLRTATGAVETVHFATYVATVMASGEWPSRLPREALEVGAVAAKQYAWYYTLKGNHRSHYRTPGGECYDVRDDTMDQLYRPETAVPTAKQLAALAETWGLSLRKNGRFFLTGYRAGEGVGCARDADGWRIYAASVVACAKKGWSRHRIQVEYYAPRIRFVWAGTAAAGAASADGRRPIVMAPEVRFARGAVLGGRVAVVTWGGADGESGIGGYRLQRRVDGGPWRNVRLPSRRATALRVELDPGHRHAFRVRARDRAGNVSEWASGASVRPEVHQTGAARLTGDWDLVRSATASDGSVRRADRRGERLSLSFRGRAVGFVAPTGQERGRIKIRVSGEVVAIIDLRSLPAGPRRIIWGRSWHTVRQRKVGLIVQGTPGRPRVDIDAFVVLR
jgi:hypothetical protein